jgi:hypothetical protein
VCVVGLSDQEEAIGFVSNDHAGPREQARPTLSEPDPEE